MLKLIVPYEVGKLMQVKLLKIHWREENVLYSLLDVWNLGRVRGNRTLEISLKMAYQINVNQIYWASYNTFTYF